MDNRQAPPQNTEIEKSVLAAAILSSKLRPEIFDKLDAEDFYKKSLQTIFRAMQEMHKKHTIDAVTLADYLKGQGKLEAAGGGSTIAKIMDTPVPPNSLEYCDRIKRYSKLRTVLNICRETMDQCFQSNTDGLDDVLSDFQSKALSVGFHGSPSWVTKQELTQRSLERYQDLNEGEIGEPVPTGFRNFDYILGGGLKPSKLYIVAARPGVGKTTLMCNMVENAAEAGYCVAVESLEMLAEDLDDRWIASGAMVSTMKLTSAPGPDVEDWHKILRAAEKQSGWKVLINENPADIRELVRRAKAMVKEGVQVLFIDQLSAISGNRSKSAYDRNTEHVETLKFLKKELNIPIVLLAQLNRELEKRNNKKPIMSDLKNTGQLEEDADVVFLGYRPGLYEQDPENCDPEIFRQAEWEIAKNRQGRTYNFKFIWNGKHQKFYQYTRQTEHN